MYNPSLAIQRIVPSTIRPYPAIFALKCDCVVLKNSWMAELNPLAYHLVSSNSRCNSGFIPISDIVVRTNWNKVTKIWTSWKTPALRWIIRTETCRTPYERRGLGFFYYQISSKTGWGKCAGFTGFPAPSPLQGCYDEEWMSFDLWKNNSLVISIMSVSLTETLGNSRQYYQVNWAEGKNRVPT